jgi:hypothetical protein
MLLMLAFRPKALDVAVVQGEVHKQQPTVEREGHKQQLTVEREGHQQQPTIKRVVHNHQPKKYVGFNF